MTTLDVLVVVPTRNRGALAINAIRSVLEQAEPKVSILVSDNSTSAADRDSLATFCASLDGRGVRLVRPPQPLSMTAHWEWVVQQALGAYPASHLLYLTDRMMFKARALGDVLALAARHPDAVISYNHDRIVDDRSPIRIDEYPATGRLLEIETGHFLQLFSQAYLHHAVPRMLNCIVPRRVLTRIHERFGSVFSSFSPDFAFCFRCLDMETSFLYYDRSPIFHYALKRSNGASVARAEMTPDNADFTANLPVTGSARNFATPIPELNTAVNAVFHEYYLFRQSTGSAKFPEVDLAQYLSANAAEVPEILDPAVRSQTLELLVAHGYKPAGTADGPAGSLRRLGSIARAAARRLAGGARRERRTRREFASVEEAIEYLQHLSPGNLLPQSPPNPLLRAREVPAM
jgi:hypothetical protein